MKLSMLLPPDPDLLVEEMKRVHLQCYVWLNALKATLFLLILNFYRRTARGNYSGLLMWFSRYQLPKSMANSGETDFKKKTLEQKSPQIKPIVAKNKKVDSSTEIENASVGLNTLNYPEERINTYGIDDESPWESDFRQIFTA